jgi:solute carrier family 10 (sodium/bile acid cotransporter), member 7
VLKSLIPDRFMLALIGALLLATLLPASGVAAEAVNWLANITVVLLFFFHGAKLARSAVIAGLTHWRLHLLILACTFVMFPLLGLLLSTLLEGTLSPQLWTGILFLAALPSTVQSSIAFVSIAQGNVPAAIASASASQVAGVLLTPLLIGLMAGAQGGDVAAAGIAKVAMLILLPFVVGHLLRPWIGDFVAKHKATIAITDRATILIAVYSAFSAAVIEGIWNRLPLADLGVLSGLCIVILAIALLFTRTAARLCGFKREDEIVVVFCGTKKSLVQGVPMARVLFAGPDVGLILLPIMIFHQIQLMVCAVIARRYAQLSTEVKNNE